MIDRQGEAAEFREVQRFRQWWIWLVVVGTTGLVVGLFGYGMIKQFVYGQPWGDRPMSDTALAVVGTAGMVLSIGVAVLFLRLKMVTEVRPEGLAVRFFPVRRLIPYEQIDTCQVRDYRPLAEYGGWGIRWGVSGRAYNVSGTCGVQLALKNGRRLLIGSQHAEELAEAIRKKLPQ